MAKGTWNRVKARARQHATTVADAIGGVLVSVGVGLIYSPAGVIVAGLLVLAASWSAAARKDAT